MQENWFVMLPEIWLIIYVAIASIVNRYRKSKTPKTFFTLAKYFLFVEILLTLVFYNKSAFVLFWQNTSFTTLFKVIVYLLTLGWLYLSSKWFLNKNHPSCLFCCIIFIMLTAMSILASSSNLLTLLSCFIVICSCYILLMFQYSHNDKRTVYTKQYIYTFLVFLFLSISAIFWLYYTSGSVFYKDIKLYFSNTTQMDIYTISAVVSLISMFVFLLGLAPFHIWIVKFWENGILPIYGFITLVPPLLYLCSFINLWKECLSFAKFSSISFILIPAYISIILGAISANGEKNIRCLFGYLSMYCIGFAITGFANMDNLAIIASFAYTIIALLSFFGIYTIFLSFKSHNDYIEDLDAIKGFSQLRPYMSAGFIIFIFSLTGLAPTLGFIGYLSIINNLFANNAWLSLGICITGILLCVRICLQIINYIYFADNTQKYDRAEKSTYICLFVNMTIIFAALINPNWLFHYIFIILNESTQ